MAQWDLILTQNVVVGVNYEDKFVNIDKGGLLSADVSQTPTVLAAGTNGYILARDDVEVTGLKWIDPASIAPAYGAVDQIPHMNTAGDGFDYSADLTFVSGTGLITGTGLDIRSGQNFVTINGTYDAGDWTASNYMRVAKTYIEMVATSQRLSINPAVADGASAVAFYMTTTNALTTAGAKLISFRNNGVEKFFVDKDGNVDIEAGAEYRIDGVPIPTGSGDVSWGTETGEQPIVFGATAGDIDSDADFTWDTTNKRFRIGYPDPAYFQVSVGGFHPTIGLTANGHPSLKFISYHNDFDISPHLDFQKQGGTLASPATIATNAEIGSITYQAYDGTSLQNVGTFMFAVDGTVATGDFDTKYTWLLKEGASAMALILTLGVDGLEYAADHSTDQAANNRWIPDKEYVDGLVSGLYWSRAASTLSPVTATDHVQLGASANLQLGGATNTYINGGPSGGNINITVSGNAKMNFTPSVTVCYQAFSTNVTDTIDIGTATSWFKDIYAQRYYLDEIGTYIYSNVGVLTFVDGTTGSKTLAELATVGSGTVTAVNNGNGMNFTNITTTGTVTLGTPGTLTSATGNGVTTSSHTHAITTGIANTNIVAVTGTVANNDYAKFNTTGLIGRTYAELAQDIDSSVFSFSATNLVTGGRLEFQDTIPLSFGNSSDFDIYFKPTTTLGLYVDGISTANDIFFSVAEAVKFTFDMGASTGTAIDWVATSDVRVKTNITPLELDMKQFLVLGSKAIRHNWKEGWGPANTPEIGFIAQDIEQFFPELVKIGKNRPHMRGLSYGKLVTVAIKATAQTWQYAVNIDAALGVVRSELEDLKSEVEELKQQLNTIQNG